MLNIEEIGIRGPFYVLSFGNHDTTSLGLAGAKIGGWDTSLVNQRIVWFNW
jgi:hypothetical protein